MLPAPSDYLPPNDLDLEIFAATVPENHYLRKVKAVIDFERRREDLLACYCKILGRPAKEPILLLKLGFLQTHYASNCCTSPRQYGLPLLSRSQFTQPIAPSHIADQVP